MKIPFSSHFALIPAVSICFMLFNEAAQAQNDVPVPSESQESLEDSLPSSPLSFEEFLADSLRMDSARKVQTERQANLRKELNALSRTTLGEDVLQWSHSMDIEVQRAGKTIAQRFWFDANLNDGPFLWLGDTLRSEEWLWFNAEQRRMATLFLNSGQGNYISKRLAEMSKMMGNGTEIAPKKSDPWQLEKEGATSFYTLQTEQGEYRLMVGEKNPTQASATVNWLKLQPIEGIMLPAAVKKLPIQSLSLSDSDGRTTYAFKVLVKRDLDPKFEVDLSTMHVNDPERSLNVIAKEWAEKNKVRETEE